MNKTKELPKNDEKAFKPVIAKQVSWIDRNQEARQAWLKEMELQYRATSYRGS